jgi:hypothetical protein
MMAFSPIVFLKNLVFFLVMAILLIVAYYGWVCKQGMLTRDVQLGSIGEFEASGLTGGFQVIAPSWSEAWSPAPKDSKDSKDSKTLKPVSVPQIPRFSEDES